MFIRNMLTGNQETFCGTFVCLGHVLFSAATSWKLSRKLDFLKLPSDLNTDSALERIDDHRQRKQQFRGNTQAITLGDPVDFWTLFRSSFWLHDWAGSLTSKDYR